MAGDGDGGSSLLRCLDYPCTKRLRLRRLLAYHRRYTHEEVYTTMNRRTRLIFEVKDLVKLVKTGKWRVAASYIIGFVPSDSMSDDATQLLLFIQDLMSLSDFAQGVTIMACLLSDWVLSIYKEPELAEYPCFATLVADVLFLRSDHASFHRRRHVNTVWRKQSTDYAQFYLRMKKRLPNSTQVASLNFSEAGSAKIRGWMQLMLLEKALQAGGPLVPEQGNTPEYSPRGGFPLEQMLSRPPFLPKFVP